METAMEKKFDPDPKRQAEIERLMALRPARTLKATMGPKGSATLMIPNAAEHVAKSDADETTEKPHLL